MKNEKSVMFQVNSVFGLLSFSDAIYNFACLPFLIFILKDVAKANLIISVLWIAMTLFEIPTGLLTDRWGGKRTLIFYLILKLVSFVFIVLGLQTKISLYFGFALLGFGLTFLTGCFSLQLKQLEKTFNLNLDYGKAISQGIKYKNILSILAILLCGLAVKSHGLVFLWYFLILFCLLEILVVSLYWDNMSNSVKQSLSFFFSEGFSFVKNHSKYQYLILINIVLLISTLSLVTNGVALLVPSLHHSPDQLMIYSLAIFAMKALSSFCYERKTLNSAVWPILLLASFMGLFIFKVMWLNIFGIIGAIFVHAQIDIFIKGQALSMIPQEISSTVLSLQSFLENIVGAIGYYILSIYLGSFSLESSLFMMAIPLFGLFIYMITTQKRLVSTSDEP